MKYLLLLNRAEDALPEPGTPAAQAMLREYTAAVQAMAEAGPPRRGGPGVSHRAGTGAARGRTPLHPAPPGPCETKE